LKKLFTWEFVVADVQKRIIGADFLKHHKLIVDLHNRTLRDNSSNESINIITSQDKKMTPSIYILNPKDKTYNILNKFPNLTEPDNFKKTPPHNIVHHIVTFGPPVHMKSRPLNPDKLKAVKSEFQKMIDLGICEPSDSEWANPIHVVSKKDGGIRVVGDYRLTNLITQPDRYTIPRIKDVKSILNNTNIYSKIDLRRAYYQIPIHPDDVKKTAVITPFGLFQFRKMAMGLSNSAQSFQRFMDMILRPLDYVFCYLDDCLIASTNETIHTKYSEDSTTTE
jgi:Reverse transcriptase (RNA-dependent DNA polymerase)